MNDDLFANLPIVKSPRLNWMERNDITVAHAVTSTGPVWRATCDRPGHAGEFASRDSEIDAIVGLALQLNIKLWNE